MPRVVERYPYVDENGTLLFEVERLVREDGKKGFRQRRPHELGGWTYGLDEADREGNVTYRTRRVLYRLPRVLEAVREGRCVFIVEGEKDVHTMERQGRVATTAPGGAGKWLPEFTKLFHGAKVAIIMDADGPGRRHGLQIAKELERDG